MSRARIVGQEYSIGTIFSNQFEFKIPEFQRPYSWDVEKANDLFDDLFTASLEFPEKSFDDLDPYFLGCIVLIKEEGKIESVVIDGQQRLITLTILLSALRASLPEKPSQELSTCIYEAENSLYGTPARYRIYLRSRDQEFFKNYIQAKDGIEKLINLRDDGLIETQKLIRDNALFFLGKLKGEKSEIDETFLSLLPDSLDRQSLSYINSIPEEKRLKLVQFILLKCYLVVVSAPTLETAYKLFSVINDRGLNLSLVDILKAEVFGRLSDEDRTKYVRDWEDLEERIDRINFEKLFSHILTIEKQTKPTKKILVEIKDHILAEVGAEKFLNKFIFPYGQAFDQIKNEGSRKDLPDELRELFYFLNRISNSDWVPPAIYYLSDKSRSKEILILFFKKLERLAAGLMLLKANATARTSRYNQLLRNIQNNKDIFVPNSPLQLTSEEQQKILSVLNGDIYLTRGGICQYVLLRLDYILSEGAVNRYEDVSIEHVLPQNPREGSEWITLFPNKEEREKRYLHKLGNLVLLSIPKNRDAQNFDFKIKKENYFVKGGISSFVLTTQVLTRDKWTPEEIEARQESLLNQLKREWELYPQKTEEQGNLFDMLEK